LKKKRENILDWIYFVGAVVGKAKPPNEQDKNSRGVFISNLWNIWGQATLDLTEGRHF
jgi:hypothetical protein